MNARSMSTWSGGVGRGRADGLSAVYALYPLPLALMLLHGEFFFWANNAFDQHPLAFPLLREAYLALGVAFAAGVAAAAVTGHLRIGTIEGTAALVVAVYVLASALLAAVSFGQPIAYGLFEERRTFALLLVFLFLWLIGRGLLGAASLIASVHVAAFIALVLGLVLQTGVLGDLAARDVPYLDPRKLRILNGTKLYMVSMVLGLAMLLYRRSLVHAVPVIVGGLGLLLVSQTRSSMLIVVIALAIVFALTSAVRFMLVAVLGVVLAAVVALVPDEAAELVADLQEALQSTFSGSAKVSERASLSLEHDARSRTAQIALEEIKRNGWIGLGALSLQWQDGFHRVYNKNFFLSDIGVLGELFRFGFFLPVVYGLVAFLMWLCRIRAAAGEGRALVTALIVLILVNAPSAGLVAFNGEIYVLMMAIAAAYARRRVRARAAPTPLTISAPRLKSIGSQP